MDFLAKGVGWLSDKLFGQADKVTGVPTPGDPMSGTDLGNSQRNYMDAAFPGTTPWERLGTSSIAPSMSAADINAKNALKLQEKEIATRERIAQDTNRASVIAAASPFGAFARDSNLRAYASSGLIGGSDYDTPTRQGRDILPEHLRKARADADVATAGAKYAEPNAKFDARLKAGKTMFDPGVMGAGALSEAMKFGKRIVDNLNNNGSAPARFKAKVKGGDTREAWINRSKRFGYSF